MRMGRWLLAFVLAVGMCGAADGANLVQSGQDVQIHAGKVIVVVRKGKRARKHRHKHHKRVKKTTVHTVTAAQPPAAKAAPVNKALRAK